MQASTYQPSGKGGAALLPMLLVGATIGIGIALPYSRLVGALFKTAHSKVTGPGELLGWGLLLLVTWILGSGGAGIVVGSTAGGVGRALRCRTGASAGVEGLALLLAAIGIYAYYSGWVLQAQGRSVLQVLPPEAIKAHLDQHLTERATSGKVMAYVGYVIEALFYYGGIKLGLESLERPYCEDCGRWTKHHKAAAHVAAPADERHQEQLVTQLEAGQVAPLQELGAARLGEERCLVLDLDVCEGCPGSSYLTVRSAKNPNQPEQTGLEAAKDLYSLASPDGIVKTMGEGAQEELNEETLVTRLHVDEAFVRSILPDRQGETA